MAATIILSDIVLPRKLAQAKKAFLEDSILACRSDSRLLLMTGELLGIEQTIRTLLDLEQLFGGNDLR